MNKYYKTINLNLNTHFIGKRIIHYKMISSTQDLAISLAEAGTPNENGTVIISDEQNGGRGRGNKEWVSLKGGIWISLIIKPIIPVKRINLLSLLPTISVCEVINELFNLETRIKWPNDIVIDNKKIAGILIDSSIKNDIINYIVIGIGINLNVEVKLINSYLKHTVGLAQKITSIHNETSVRSGDRLILLKKLLERIEYYLILAQNNIENTKLIQIYKQLSNTIGKSIYVYSHENKKYSAFAYDIDNDCSLLIKKEDKNREKIYFGEISIREK
ncbi:MAG TPA: biotin--[acetyl-CoA-carboxylase] ligase [Nitrososphaeraceae archaeon]|nr:biotin--[acetyl-CoA-carboxylase] ligase [Nitrososphaeraceae archaeon]